MKITELISMDSIELKGKCRTKEEAIRDIAVLMDRGGKLKDKSEYIKGLKKRESISTTAVGEGIAIPHYKGSAVKSAGLSAIVVKEGCDFKSVDGKKVNLIFGVAAPDTEDNVHLDVLSALSVLLMDESFVNALINAKSKKEFVDIIDRAEGNKKSENKDNTFDDLKILAVTSCPTGIAHTYMAAESLEKAAKKLNVKIKVETRGSGGTKNILSDEEIENSRCIIIAADTKVPMDRFDGKKVIITSVSDGISNAEKLINDAIKGEGAIHNGNKLIENSRSNRTGIYKHLMSGVSHMLPFVVGGGILIALAFLFDDFSINPSNFGMNKPFSALLKSIGSVAFSFMLPVLSGYIAYSIADRPGMVVGFVGGMLASDGNPVIEFAGSFNGISGYLANTVFNSSGNTVSGFLGALLAGFVAGYIIILLKKVFSGLSKNLDGIKTILLYPIFGILLMGITMLFVFNPIIGIINDGLASFLNTMSSSSRVVLGLILGAMMAFDMGGPINKAAYVFGVASIATGNYDIMAAVMIGGMVPPIGIALATYLYKNKFTEEEKNTSVSNIVMGLSFITEGAIPFAAADPIHVIPATAIGAGVAGALSMLFNCTLMAPHGGIFVFAIVGNWPMYLLALAVGSLTTMLLLGLFKKDLRKQGVAYERNKT